MNLGWHFRMLFQSSKLKARRSLFTETWQKRLWAWALSFRKCHPKWDLLYNYWTKATGHNVPCRDSHQNPSLASSLGLQPSHGFKLTACCYLLSRDGHFNSEQQQIGWKQYEAVLVLVLVCHAATQLAIQLHQERIQVVRSNRVARKRSAESNSTPTMDLGFEDIRKRKHTNKKGIRTTHIHKHATLGTAHTRRRN